MDVVMVMENVVNVAEASAAAVSGTAADEGASAVGAWMAALVVGVAVVSVEATAVMSMSAPATTSCWWHRA